MKNNYSVYQHVTPDGMYYFGATQNVERRWEGNGRLYKRTALQPYIEKFGWENIQHIVLFENQSKENALWIEDFLITTAQEDGVCINKQRSGLVSKEEGYQQQISKQYYQKNKEQILEQRREYREQNRDKIKQYYEQNKDKFREQNRDKIKQYYETNKEHIREKQQQYYEQNKDKWKEYRERNKDKMREYQRQYRKRKKLEKQLKEVVETTLF